VVNNALQGLALAHGLRRGAGLWTRDGQATLASLPEGCRNSVPVFCGLWPPV